MSLIKEELLLRQEEEQELWESYLEWLEDNEDIWHLLPKNIRDEVTYEN